MTARLDVEAAREEARVAWNDLTLCLGPYTTNRIQRLVHAAVAEALHNLMSPTASAGARFGREGDSNTPAGDDGSATRKDAGAPPLGGVLRCSPSPAGPSAPPAAGEVDDLMLRHGLLGMRLRDDLCALAAREYQRGWDDRLRDLPTGANP